MEEKENIIIHLNNDIYLIPTQQVKLMIWHMIPEWLKTHNCVEAKIQENAFLRTAIKGVLITLGPKMLKKLNLDIIPPKKVDIISWWIQLFSAILFQEINKEDWIINVKPCEECGEGIYKINGLSPFSFTNEQTIKTHVSTDTT